MGDYKIYPYILGSKKKKPSKEVRLKFYSSNLIMFCIVFIQFKNRTPFC